MKPVRFLLLLMGVVAAILIAAFVLAFNSGFQSWAARKILASQPDVNATLGAISVGLGRVEIRSIRAEQKGAVLTLPALVAELPVLTAGVSRKITVTKLVARGWTLDLTKATAPSVVAPPPPATVQIPVSKSFSLLGAAYAADSVSAIPASLQVFQGVLAQLQLPVDLTLDGLDLDGEIILPPASPDGSPARAHFTLSGGGLGSGREGRFALVLTLVFSDQKRSISNVSIHANLTAAMDTPRTFTRLVIEPTALATGPQFPDGVKLSAALSAVRVPTGETYAVTFANPAQQLMVLNAELRSATRTLAGTWQLNLRSTDLTPFALGRALPSFIMRGDGKFSTDTSLAEIRASARLTGTADQLGVIKPELAAIGSIHIAAEFDLAQRGNSTRIEQLVAEVNGTRPVASVRSLQPFEFNVKTGELKVADATHELLSIKLQGLPLAWAQPFFNDVTLTGGDLRGEFAATANNGGLTLRSGEPLTVAGLAMVQGGKAWVRAIDVSLALAVDYTPLGWQADISAVTLRSAGETLLQLSAKAGQLTGRDQPLKATGQWSANLPALLAQPFMAGSAGLIQGKASGTLVASVASTTELELKLALAELKADPKTTLEGLPDVTANVRADIAADGKITLKAPFIFSRAERKSDVTLAGTLGFAPTGLRVEARVSSGQLHLEDIQILAAPFASRGTPAVASATTIKSASLRDTKPVWAGLSGSLTLAFKKLVYADKFEVSDVGGTLLVEAGSLKLEGIRAGLGAQSDLKLNGAIAFMANAVQPYTFAAQMDVANFDPGPVLRALNPAQLPTLEGKFTIGSRWAGEGQNLLELGGRVQGEFTLSSKGGLFRALSAELAAKVDSTSKTASAVAFLGNMASAVSGRKDYGEVANKAEAMASLSKMIAAIQYDQLNVVISRDAALNTVLKDFTLIAPELRLVGSGRIEHNSSLDLAEQSFAMQFQLSARGYTATLLKSLGALDGGKKDDLGYLGSTLPLRITGTLSKPDTGELQANLMKLAYEKSGAGDLLNKILGGK